MPQAAHVRPSTTSDRAALSALVEATGLLPAELLDGMMSPFLADPSGAEQWLTAEVDGRVAGVAYYAPEPVTSGTWNVLLLAVDPSCQGTGIGTQLMRRVEADLAATGQRVLLVETSGTPEFRRTRRFYLGLGYAEQARIPGYYDAGDDKVIFLKALESAPGRAAAPPGTEQIVALTTVDELDELRSLWISLHRHHQTVSDYEGFVRDDETSWERRRGHYAQLLATGVGVGLLARDERGPAGYAFARVIPEPNDSFDTAGAYAELETLSVRADARSRGIGARLLDRLDETLADRGVHDMVVSVISANTRAARFYERRGFVPVETYLWRVTGA